MMHRGRALSTLTSSNRGPTKVHFRCKAALRLNSLPSGRNHARTIRCASYGINSLWRDHIIFLTSGPSNIRLFATSADKSNIITQSQTFSYESHEQQEQNQTLSNRAAFLATPVVPSILTYIQKIGVGIRPKRSRLGKRKGKGKGGGKMGARNNRKSEVLDEGEEEDYFSKVQTNHRMSRLQVQQSKNDRHAAAKKGGASSLKKGQTLDESNDGSEATGAYWLPPPPFSTFMKEDREISKEDSNSKRKIIRRPVKVLGKAGSLSDTLPLQSKGLSEVALAGRSNVGKSTLLNALLYGNIDENLAPRKYQRGRTPPGAKLPKGIKAVTSDTPGETKELSFYQLTADIISKQGDDEISDNKNDKDETKKVGKMSLLLVDLPGYGFAFAKEERAKQWQDLMHHYLLERKSLKRILLLLDARHGFKKADFDFLTVLQDGLLASNNEGKKAKRELPPLQIVLTKCDLVSQSDLARRVVIVRQQLSDFLIREPSVLPVMLVSARAGVGFNNIRGEQPLGGVLELQKELASLVPVPRFHGK